MPDVDSSLLFSFCMGHTFRKQRARVFLPAVRRRSSTPAVGSCAVRATTPHSPATDRELAGQRGSRQAKRRLWQAKRRLYCRFPPHHSSSADAAAACAAGLRAARGRNYGGEKSRELGERRGYGGEGAEGQLRARPRAGACSLAHRRNGSPVRRGSRSRAAGILFPNAAVGGSGGDTLEPATSKPRMRPSGSATEAIRTSPRCHRGSAASGLLRSPRPTRMPRKSPPLGRHRGSSSPGARPSSAPCPST